MIFEGLEPGQMISSTMITRFYLERKNLDPSSEIKRRKITNEDSLTAIDEELNEKSCFDFSCFCLPNNRSKRNK